MRRRRSIVLWIAVAAGSLALPAAGEDDAATAQLAQACAACHGADGNSQNPAYPILAGQSWRYIYIQLRDFKEGRRKDPQMSPMAADLTRDQMIALGNHFAAKKPKPTGFKADPARVEAGKKLSDTTLCPMCHLGGFVGQNEIPRVAGQWPQYVKKQLEDFRAKRRTNDAGNMTSVSRNLSDEDIENLAHYIANL
ncbi:MAG: c-type cytochrome [Betaproteobacteria bacterium]